MSIAIRTKRPIPVSFPSPLAEPSRPSYPRPCHAEAPDRGYLAHEAPESRAGRSSEAPEAGDGRMSSLECQFTHGRSQS